MSYISPLYFNKYNNLPSIEDANRFLSSVIDFDKILNSAGEILAENLLHQVLGFRLLHRHNNLAIDQVMLQRREVQSDGSDSLVTARVIRSSCEDDLFPAVWTCKSNGSIEPLEYCLFKESMLPHDFFNQNKEVFSNIYKVLHQAHLHNSIGLFLLRPDAMDMSNPDYIGLESIDVTRAANIVKLVERNTELTAITTSWNFDATAQQRCIPFNQCVPRSPGHDVTPGHEFVEDD